MGVCRDCCRWISVSRTDADCTGILINGQPGGCRRRRFECILGIDTRGVQYTYGIRTGHAAALFNCCSGGIGHAGGQVYCCTRGNEVYILFSAFVDTGSGDSYLVNFRCSNGRESGIRCIGYGYRTSFAVYTQPAARPCRYRCLRVGGIGSVSVCNGERRTI